MGIINECMLKEQKQKIPSEIQSKYGFPNDLEYYRKTYKNSPLYNEYLQQQCYRTQVIEPSEKNSSVYNKMVECSQPPSELFNKIISFKNESEAKQFYRPIKVRRTNHSHSQTVNRPKTTRRSGQPLSYTPMKLNEHDCKQMDTNTNQETFITQV